MAESFDPYYKWLGIPPKYQPPDHYRLLGIELFESDPEVIEVAADKQVDYLKRCATGPHVECSQKLLNEISAARLCLLNPAKKSAYDATLKENADAAAADAEPRQEPFKIGSRVKMAEVIPETATAAAFDWNSDQSTLPDGSLGAAQGWYSGKRKSSRRRRGPSPVGIIISSLCGLGVAMGIYVWMQRKPEDKEPLEEANVSSPDNSSLDHSPLPVHKSSGSVALGSAASAEKSKQEKSVTPPPEKTTPSEPKSAQAAETKPPLTATGAPHEREAAVPPGRLQPKTPSTDSPEPPPGRDSAPAVVAQPLSARADALVKMRDSATTPAEFREVAEKGMDLVSEAIAGGDPATAKRIAAVVLAAARKSGDNQLEKKATLSFLEAKKH